MSQTDGRVVYGNYPWTRPVIISALVLAVVLMILTSSAPDRGEAVAVIAGIWVLYAAYQANLMTQQMIIGPGWLRVRRWFRWVSVQASEITEVRGVFSLRGPDFSLLTSKRRVLVPTSLLAGGHSNLFEWLDAYAPQAKLDTRAELTRKQLVERGLIGPDATADNPYGSLS